MAYCLLSFQAYFDQMFAAMRLDSKRYTNLCRHVLVNGRIQNLRGHSCRGLSISGDSTARLSKAD